MKRAGTVASAVVRGTKGRPRTNGRSLSTSPPSSPTPLKQRIAQAKEAIMRDGRLGDMDMRVGWKTNDAINTDPTYPLFGRSWLSAQTIAGWIGADRRSRPRDESTVRRAWLKNIKCGYIERIRRGGTGKTDLFKLPADRASSHAQDEVLTVRVRPSDRASSPDNLPYDPIKSSLLGKESVEGWEQKRRQMREVMERVKAGSDA